MRFKLDVPEACSTTRAISNPRKMRPSRTHTTLLET